MSTKAKVTIATLALVACPRPRPAGTRERDIARRRRRRVQRRALRVHGAGKGHTKSAFSGLRNAFPSRVALAALLPHAYMANPRMALLVLALAALASPALAAGTAADEAAAEALFRDGRRLLAEKNFAAACPKFEESSRLSPSVGALLSLGDCLESSGKLASSWGAFVAAGIAAHAKGDTVREAEAERRAALLTPKLSKLAIVVPPLVKVPGFQVTRDGTAVGEAQWGSMMPVDAGHHLIEASAPKHRPWSVDVRVEENANAATIEVSPLEKLPELPPHVVGEVSGWSTQRKLGVAGMVIGGTGIAIGSALGAVAIVNNNLSKSECSPSNPNFCNAAGFALRAQVTTFGNGSTAAFVIGGAFLVGGLALFATASSKVEVVPGVGALALRGRF